MIMKYSKGRVENRLEQLKTGLMHTYEELARDCKGKIEHPEEEGNVGEMLQEKIIKIKNEIDVLNWVSGRLGHLDNC